MRTPILCVLLAASFTLSSFAINYNANVQCDVTAHDESTTSLSFQFFDLPEWSGVLSESFPDTQSSLSNLITSANGFPSHSGLIRLPFSGGASIQTSDTAFEIRSDVSIAAFIEEFDYPDSLVLIPEVDAWFPESIVTLSEPKIFRDFRVASVSVTPFQYNPAREELRIYSNVQTTVTYNNESSINELPGRPVRISETFLPFYQMFLDWDDCSLDEFTLYRGGIQVVVQNNETILNALEPWIEWKRQKGWKIELLTDSDIMWTRADIQAGLMDLYESAEIPFDYVVIIGDADGGIVTPPGTPNPTVGGGDHPYSCLAGDDYLMDVCLGRISVENITQLNTYVQKVLSYERDPYMDETDWYLEASGCAGSVLSGISTVYVIEYAKRTILNHGYNTVHTAYYNDNQGNVNERTIGFLNDGVSFHIYRGYLGTGLSPDQVLNLNNTNRLPVVIDITCGRGNWATGISVNEAFMRAGTPTNPCGGIGAMSTATISTRTKYNNAMVGGGVEAAFVQDVQTLGQVYFSAKLNMWYNLYDFLPDDVENFCDWLNLMGDPTVWIWTNIPREIEVEAEDSFEIGMNSFEVSVSDNGMPLSNAWVTLYRSDELEEMIVRGITDENGSVILNAPFHSAGEAVLTVTAQNAQPVQQTITIESPAERLGYTEITIIDDGSQGTSGNGNEIADFGETVGLICIVRNFGGSAQTGITITASSEDPWIESVSGSSEFNDIAPDDEITADSPLLISINPDCPNDWNATVNIALSGSEGEYNDLFSLPVVSPELIHTQTIYSSPLVPGANADISFELDNIGMSGSTYASLTLISNDDWLTIDAPEGELGELDPGESGTTRCFGISASQYAFEGYIADASLIADFNDGRHETLPLQILIGLIDESNPTGPDAAGYIVYESTDIDYNLHPQYNWIEINPQLPTCVLQGSYLDLPDYNENEDCAVALDLPFDFTYYGESYSQITVCSNGWLAVGDQHTDALQRNWQIPSPLGPDGMIAPFWDDRTIPVSPSMGGVFAYIDEVAGFCIIEWDRVRDGLGQAECSFQAILFETTDVYPTPTGNDEFLFQYKRINPSEGHYSDVDYWTTGIENSEQTDGIQLHFYNHPSESVAPLSDESAYLFTSRTSYITGTAYGTVTDFETEEPLANVLVTSNSHVETAITNEEGHYELPCGVGEHTISFSKIGYGTTGVIRICMEENTNIEVNAALQRPVMAITPDSLAVVIRNDEQTSETILLENTGGAPLSFEIDLNVYSSSEGGTIGDIQCEIPLDELIEGDIVSDGEWIWLLARASDNNMYMHQYSHDFELLDTYLIGDYDFVNMQFVDNFYMLYTTEDVYRYTFTGDQFELDYSGGLPRRNVTATLYNPVDELWYSLSLNGITICDVNHAVIETIYLTPCWYWDFEWVPDDPDGYTIHMVTTDYSEDPNSFVVRTNLETELSETLFGIPATINVENPSIGIYTPPNSLSKTVALVTETPSTLTLLNYTADMDWFVLNPTSGVVDPGEQQDVILDIDGSLLPVGVFTTWLQILHTAEGSPSILPLSLTVTATASDETPTLPKDWTLSAVYPNPFNPVTTVGLELPSTSEVHARLYNTLGQEVMEVMNTVMDAGYHTVQINGSELSSGIYFLRMDAGPLHEVRKLVLLK